LQRHGISRLPKVDREKPRRFKSYEIGYFHIDIAELRYEGLPLRDRCSTPSMISSFMTLYKYSLAVIITCCAELRLQASTMCQEAPINVDPHL